MDIQTERGNGTELYYARCAVLHAARWAKIDAFNVVFPDINDDAGFLKGVDKGKSLINPRQIELLHNAAYTPSVEEADYARSAAAATEQAKMRRAWG